MAIISSRRALVDCRTQLVNHVRGAVKSFGHRLPKCPARSFHKRAPEHIPKALMPALGPILEQIGSLTERIRDYDRQLQEISEEHYPETELLRQVEGVRPLTALTFVLTLEDPYRFAKSRCVGAYLGLVPARDRSGDSDPQKRISKEGEKMLRKLLVGSAHYILGPFGSDSDLRRHGEKIASRGAKNAKKRAAVAVARKLAVLLPALEAAVWRDKHVARLDRRELIQELEVREVRRSRAGSLQALDFGLADTCCGASAPSSPTRQKEASGKQRARAVRMISQEETEGYSHLTELPPGRTAIRGLPEGTKFWTRSGLLGAFSEAGAPEERSLEDHYRSWLAPSWRGGADPRPRSKRQALERLPNEVSRSGGGCRGRSPIPRAHLAAQTGSLLWRDQRCLPGSREVRPDTPSQRKGRAGSGRLARER